MKDDVFKKLQKGVEEAVAIEKGEQADARVTIYFEPREMKRIRTSLKLSQRDFADRFGIPIATVRHWEQGRRQPDRAALAFYRILKEEPKAAMRAFG